MKRSITPVVLGLIIINGLIHLVGVINDKNPQWLEFRDKYLLLHKVNTFGLHKVDYPGEFSPIQTLGSAFSHGSHIHILFNMMCLYFFGPVLERHMGAVRFLMLYLFAAIVGGFILAYCDPSPKYVLGASGAICGLLVAFAWLFPQSRMGLMFIPVFLPSRIFTGLFAAISAGLVVHAYTSGSSLGGISHAGHLAGMIAGFIFMVGYMKVTKGRPASQRM